MAVQRRHDMGAGGHCVCPQCGEQTVHHRGIPRQEEHCPECGAKMFRDGSYHHQLSLKKQKEKKQKNNTYDNRIV